MNDEDKPGYSELMEERNKLLIKMVNHILEDIDSSNYKYGCSLNSLVYRIRRCIDEWGISEIIVPEMLNTAAIYKVLIEDGYITKDPGSWCRYDCQLTGKGRIIGISKKTKSGWWNLSHAEPVGGEHGDGQYKERKVSCGG